MADKPKLTRAERKQIEAVIRKYRGDGKPHTAQDTIPYQIMYPNGICYLGNRRYSQSIEFFDINYLLAQPDDQTAIFEYLCDLYNYLDSSIHVQFTYPNRKSDREQLARSFEMPPVGDGLDPIRQEQTDILKRQLARGNNGSVKTKYITYTIEADNLKAARARLSRISLDIQGYFKIMGAVSRVLDGKERLEVLHGIMHPDGERFNFDWKWLAAGGLSTKDFIAPSSFAFKNSRMFQMGGKLCAASFLQIITPELTDRILTDFLDTDSSLVVNVHIQALEQTEAVKMVKRKITDLDAMKIQEQKKAVRDGYDMDILPSDLATYGGAAKKLLHGQIIKLSPTSRDYLNPLDINLNYSEDENPLALKSDFVLSLCELIMGGKTGLEAIERTVIDRAVQRIYQPYFADPRPENMPILSDLHAALTAQHLPEADRVAQALDLYVSGSLNFFNNRTTVDIDNRFVCFDIKELPKNLKKPGMLVIQDQVWNRVTRNRNTGVSTWYYADEFHLLLKEPQTAAYSAEIWKRFRKWGGVPTGATQNVKDLLSSPEIENILENSDFICMLNQAAGDRKILAERLNISPEQLKFVTNSPPGEGLLFFENVILPFADKFPRDTELYRIMSTKPSEVNGV